MFTYGRLVDRWREILQVGGEDALIQLVWELVHEILVTAPKDFIQQISHSLSSWLQIIAKTFNGHEDDYFTLCDILLSMDYQAGEESDKPVLSAINHPIGHITEALVRWWYRSELKDGEGLNLRLKPIFTSICDIQNKKFIHGRVLLSAHAITIFRMDKNWATEYLLPLFNWNNSELEARSAWEGFLWSPRLYLPFLYAIKNELIETASHYNDITDHAGQYASFLTFLALDPGDAFSDEDLSNAIVNLPAEGLKVSASALGRALDGTKEQRDEYWKNRVKPFIKNCWPQSLELLTPQISESIARVCVSAKSSFDEAVHEFQHWLRPVEHPDYLVHILHETDLSTKFPSEALLYLDALISDDAQWLPEELMLCLDKIVQTDPQLINDPRYVRLVELGQRRGLI